MEWLVSLHVLFIGFVWPEPKSSAAGQNILSYAQACLHAKWRVSFCSSAQPSEHSVNLQAMGIHTFDAELNCSTFNQELSALQPDIVIFDRFLSFEQFAWRVKQACPNALLVLDAEDLHCLREARHLLFKQMQKNGDTTTFMKADDILLKENMPLLYNPICLRELTCIYQADLTLTLSDFEYTLLHKHFNVPKKQLAHVAFIFDESLDLLPYKNERAQKHDFIFIGNFRHAPNFIAAKTLSEQCWPAIYKTLKASYPNISCHIYGAYMSPKAKQLEKTNLNLHLHGYAPNQFEVIAKARVMLAPISFGAGVKGKLLDAMQVNTPSVTTSIGLEGISQQHWQNTPNTIKEFIQSAIELYNNAERWHSANEETTKILKTEYDAQQNTQKLIDAIKQAYESRDSLRAGNFLQQLLWQKQLQASKYMSQWIEAKNKNLS